MSKTIQVFECRLCSEPCVIQTLYDTGYEITAEELHCALKHEHEDADWKEVLRKESK